MLKRAAYKIAAQEAERVRNGFRKQRKTEDNIGYWAAREIEASAAFDAMMCRLCGPNWIDRRW